MTRAAAAAAAVLSVALLAGCSLTSPAARRPDPPGVAAASQELDELAVKGRAPKTGYSRAQFGRSWEDVDHNGCDTRNDVLRRDLRSTTLKPGTSGCVVLTGTLADPYTGRLLTFDRRHASTVQIDHVVALSDAWQTGAQQWSIGRRTAFANDPRNLQATDGPTNERKGDSDAASWLPPDRDYRCTYVRRQVDVKATYGLWVTPAEHDALARVLGGCG